jgi:hypothetical protein
MPDELKAYVPHEYAENHSTFSELFWKNSNTFMESIVCVTRRFVKDEELFLNYRPRYIDEPKLVYSHSGTIPLVISTLIGMNSLILKKLNGVGVLEDFGKFFIKLRCKEICFNNLQSNKRKLNSGYRYSLIDRLILSERVDFGGGGDGGGGGGAKDQFCELFVIDRNIPCIKRKTCLFFT